MLVVMLLSESMNFSSLSFQIYISNYTQFIANYITV